jgi:hypothetical protein
MNPERLLATCRAIVASKSVTQFVVGITTNPEQRRTSYDRWARRKGGNLDGFAVLEWGLTRTEVVDLERYLFENLVDHPGYGVIDMRYYPSVKPVDNQFVYIAWWSPYLVYVE